MSNNKVLRLPKVGEPAPDFELSGIDGSRVKLSEYPRPTHITFLRHLA